MVFPALKQFRYVFAALTLGVVPFLSCNAAVDQSYAVKSVFLGVVVGLWALTERPKPLSASFRNYLLLYGALVAWSFVSLLWAHDIGEGLKAAFRLAVAWGFISLMGRLLAHRPSLKEKLIVLIAAVAVLTALVGLAQWAGWGFRHIEGWRGFYPWATLHNPNMLASYLFLGLPAVGYVAFRQKNLRWPAVAGVMLILFVLVLTRCRTMVFCLGIGLTAIAISQATGGALRFPLHVRRILLVGALLGGLVIVASAPHMLDAVIARYEGRLDQRSLHQRLAMWSVSCKMLLDRPLTGVGAGQWNIEADSYGLKHTLPRVAHVAFIRPHNDFLWRGAELGFVGFWLYGVVLLWPATATWRRRDLPGRCAWFALAGYLADAAFNFPSERPEAFVLHHFWVAVAFSSGGRTEMVRTMTFHCSSVHKIICFMAGVLFSYISFQQLKSEIAFHHVLAAHDRRDWRRMVEQARRADNALNRIAPTGWPTAYYEGVALAEMGRPAEAEAALRRAAAAHPYHAATWRRLGELQATQGDTSEAAACFRKARALCPGCGENL